MIQENFKRFFEEIPLLNSIALILDPRVKSKCLELMLKHFFNSLYDDDFSSY